MHGNKPSILLRFNFYLIIIKNFINSILIIFKNTKRCYSWKCPDKLACELNIKDLLDRFKFGTDEIDNQFAHYSLLELIIDRYYNRKYIFFRKYFKLNYI
jgi:hypothetical protein